MFNVQMCEVQDDLKAPFIGSFGGSSCPLSFEQHQRLNQLWGGICRASPQEHLMQGWA